MLAMETKIGTVAFTGLGAVMAQEIAPLGFTATLAQIHGRGGVLITAAGIPVGDYTTVRFAHDHMAISDGCGAVQINVSADQTLHCDTQPAPGSVLAQLMAADGMILLHDDRVLFSKNGMTLAVFALGIDAMP